MLAKGYIDVPKINLWSVGTEKDGGWHKQLILTRLPLCEELGHTA